MTSITIIDLLTTIYVLVDDWYQAEGQALLAGKRGAKPEFNDSEMLTLMVAQDFIPYPGETQFVRFMRANYLALFPKLLDQSQFNRRSRALRFLVDRLRQAWLLCLVCATQNNCCWTPNPFRCSALNAPRTTSRYAQDPYSQPSS